MSLKNLYDWNGGFKKSARTSCGDAMKSTGCESVAVLSKRKSTGCEGPCGLKRPSGCESFAKSSSCSAPSIK